MQAEWQSLSEAERAEAERRRVVEAARPAALAAEEREHEALLLRCQAADTEFHAQVGGGGWAVGHGGDLGVELGPMLLGSMHVRSCRCGCWLFHHWWLL